jgi:hypothetical protein
MDILHPHLTIDDTSEPLSQIHSPGAHRLDLAPCQDQTSLYGVFDEVLVVRFAVGRDNLLCHGQIIAQMCVFVK